MTDYKLSNDVPDVKDGGAGATGPRKLALLFLLSAVFFFPMIMNPYIIGFYDAESDAARVEHIEENLTALRFLFTGIGLTEIALGVALWLWGRHVSGTSSGRRATVAQAFSWIGLAAGLTAIVGRLLPLLDDVETWASGDISSVGLVVSLITFAGFSLTLIVFGVLMIRGAMPTWLGVVWILCGLLFWGGFLPLWFFVAALVFGIWGLLRFRPGQATVARISADRAG